VIPSELFTLRKGFGPDARTLSHVKRPGAPWNRANRTSGGYLACLPVNDQHGDQECHGQGNNGRIHR